MTCAGKAQEAPVATANGGSGECCGRPARLSLRTATIARSADLIARWGVLCSGFCGRATAANRRGIVRRDRSACTAIATERPAPGRSTAHSVHFPTTPVTCRTAFAAPRFAPTRTIPAIAAPAGVPAPREKPVPRGAASAIRSPAPRAPTARPVSAGISRGFCCGGTCTTGDDLNCSACGDACPTGSHCVSSACLTMAGVAPQCSVCPAGTACDGQACVTTTCNGQATEANPCTQAGVFGGRCCASTCGGLDDPANCGVCGRHCGEGHYNCSDGYCISDGGQVSDCAEVVCPAGEVCIPGFLSCAAGAAPARSTGKLAPWGPAVSRTGGPGHPLRGRCVDPGQDPANCGQCGLACASGTCPLIPYLAGCPPAPNPSGNACALSCPAGEFCFDHACTPMFCSGYGAFLARRGRTRRRVLRVRRRLRERRHRSTELRRLWPRMPSRPDLQRRSVQWCGGPLRCPWQDRGLLQSGRWSGLRLLSGHRLHRHRGRQPELRCLRRGLRVEHLYFGQLRQRALKGRPARVLGGPRITISPPPPDGGGPKVTVRPSGSWLVAAARS